MTLKVVYSRLVKFSRDILDEFFCPESSIFSFSWIFSITDECSHKKIAKNMLFVIFHSRLISWKSSFLELLLQKKILLKIFWVFKISLKTALDKGMNFLKPVAISWSNLNFLEKFQSYERPKSRFCENGIQSQLSTAKTGWVKWNPRKTALDIGLI